MAVTTLDQARGIVRAVTGTPTYPRLPTIRPEGGPTPTPQFPWEGGGVDITQPPATGATPTRGKQLPPGVIPYGYSPPYFDIGATENTPVTVYGNQGLQGVYQDDAGFLYHADGTPFAKWEYEAFYGPGGGGSTNGGGGGGFDTGPGYLNLAGQKFASDEQQRAIDNAFAWQQLLNSQKYADRNFDLSQTQANRGELANRAGTALNFGNLALNLAQRSDALANNPGNFPAYLQAMQGNTANMPTLQALVGQGVAVHPQQNTYLDDPRFKNVMDSLFNYSTVPNPAGVSAVQQAYNTDPNAAQRWFEAAAALDAGKGAATGGVYDITRPMRMQDLTTGQTVGVAGEAGPETVTVSPSTGYDTTPGLGSAGTFGALAKAIQANGMYSAIPRDVVQRMSQGFAPNPGDVPDWVLAKLPPSLRQLLGAGILAQLGQSGAEDYNWTRALYEPRGFSGLGGVVR